LLGVPFEVRPVDLVEDIGDASRPELVALRLAREKAEAARLREPLAAILAADTVVILNGDILGKPAGPEEARTMLRRLRGGLHRVITGVALMRQGRVGVLLRHTETKVKMRRYAEGEIDESIARGDPFDKAGGYAIQDQRFNPVEEYEGCFCNVVGLPLWPVAEMLRKSGAAVDETAANWLPQCVACPLRPPAFG
jgi:septum formation protein